MTKSDHAQSIAVKRAQVEFHNFASLGQPEVSLPVYAEENRRRGALIHRNLDFIGEMTPFLEVGANAGHTSYLLANDFGAAGFALDISADALRHGVFLMDHWQYDRAPVRVGGDALNLPFRDGALRFVMTHQTLSQFMDIDAVFAEIHRVLAPGGVFLFSEEPIRRMLSLRLYRCPYYDTMKPWERRLYDWGLLGFLVKDVIGAHQEESFGIRQNHRMTLPDWVALMGRHFPEHRTEIVVPQRGFAERWVRSLGLRLDKHGSDWVPARLLGGTLAAFCRKAGAAAPVAPMTRFEELLRCPDCHGALERTQDDGLRCGACSYDAPNEGGVYNLIRSEERRELYPGARADLIDFTQPGHEERLRGAWGELEGVFGAKYRWLSGAPAVALLERLREAPQRLRIRGHAHERVFEQGRPVRVAVRVNGAPLETFPLERNGLFVLEADLPDARQYEVEIQASPEWEAPPDDRRFTVNVSMVRLIDRG
ncbi:MAG: class I SAM-dependent methyltransferase [Bryobacteraceae bacterium]